MTQTSSAKKKTVLVCDDHATLLLMLKSILSGKGFDVITAGDGEEGLDLVRLHGPDLLLLDLAMPTADGLAVLNGMKQLGDKKRPYTIVISAHESQEKRDMAAKLGAQEIWKKPFNAAELLARIESLIQRGLI